ncbi:MAG: type III secretion inner membrane ring lipoprotein SctJ [Burkholderiaceae bacterium]|nr:type III secretion inner membrane ring lipoprotein SctJ [Burkholderiaceae bacterium]
MTRSGCVALVRHLRFILAALLLVGLTACGSNVMLFSASTEAEANEVLSVLLDAGIKAEKLTGKEGVAVLVNAPQVARALDILRSQGLPRERFDGMGQIFRKEGLVSSPLEERARYIYALSQELTNTLSQMDGVLAARVHVVLPERGGVGETAMPSTAAVFLKHQVGYTLDALQPQIRKLVTHAIPGLTEDRVSIVLVSAQPSARASDQPLAMASLMGFQVDPGSASGLGIVIGVLFLLLIALLIALGYLGWRQGWFSRTTSPARREPVQVSGDSVSGGSA